MQNVDFFPELGSSRLAPRMGAKHSCLAQSKSLRIAFEPRAQNIDCTTRITKIYVNKQLGNNMALKLFEIIGKLINNNMKSPIGKK